MYSLFTGTSHKVEAYVNVVCCCRGAVCRSPGVVRHWESHTQEVCGVRWSPDRQYLASGGNDNKVGGSQGELAMAKQYLWGAQLAELHGCTV